MEGDYVPLNKGSHIHWLLASFLSLAFLGVGTFIIGVYAFNPVVVKGMCSTGYLIFAFFSTLWYWVSQCSAARELTGLKQSTLVVQTANGGHKLASGVFTGSLGGVFTAVGQLSLILGFFFDPDSRGIISSTVVGSALVSSIVAHFYYHEAISLLTYAGMVVCLGGIITIAFSTSTQAGMIGFGFGVCALLAFSLRNLASRECERAGLDVVTAGVLNAGFEGISGLLFTGGYIAVEYNPFEGEGRWYYSLLGGVLIAVGAYMLNQAIMTGYIGPAVTIANLVPIIQITLDYLLDNKVPNYMKVLGCLIGIFGVFIMMMGDIIVNAVFKGKHKRVNG